MPRCTAVTSSGKRCRCNAAAGSERCANHASAQTYGVRTPSAEELALYRAEIEREDAEYKSFYRAYYNTLREFYNVAGAEMQDEYVSYRTYGLSNYNKMHEKQYKGFLEMVKRDDPNSYYALFVHIERRRQAKRQEKRQAKEAAQSPSLAPDLSGNPCPCGANRGADCDCWEDQFREEEGNHCPICYKECEPADDDGHCSYSCASGGGR